MTETRKATRDIGKVEELKQLMKYVTVPIQLRTVDLKDTTLSYEDIYNKAPGDLIIDLKCNYPVLIDTDDNINLQQFDIDELVIAAGSGFNSNVFYDLLDKIDYLNEIPTKDYEKTALYYFNTHDPKGEFADVLYRYSDYIELFEIKRANIDVIQRFITKGDYSYSIESCKILLQKNIPSYFLNFIISQTITENQFYDEDIDFLLKCVSLNNKHIISLIKSAVCLLNIENKTLLKRLIELYTENTTTSLNNLKPDENKIIIKYAPYKLLIDYPNSNDEYLDRAYLEYIIKEEKIPKIKEGVVYPATLSYALYNDINIPFCHVSKEDVIKYPNLITVLHTQMEEFSFVEIKTMHYLLEDKYIIMIKHASNEELEGFVELTFLVENARKIISYNWLATLCAKCGLHNLEEWLLKFKSVEIIFDVFQKKMEEEEQEEDVELANGEDEENEENEDNEENNNENDDVNDSNSSDED